MSFARCRFVLAPLLLGAAISVSAADRCTPDTLFFTGFDTIAGPSIEGLVAGVERGTLEVRSSQTVVATATVERGSYALVLPELAPEAMIELRVRGLAELGQDFVELASLVGTVAQLRDEADADGITRLGRVPTLAVSPESSARYALFAQAASADMPRIPHECALAQDTAALDPAAVFERAAVLKILIADGGINARRSKGEPVTTLTQLIDEGAYQDTMEAIESGEPGRIAALQAIMAQPFCDYFAEDVLLVVVERLTGEWLTTFSGEAYERTSPAGGINTDFGGSDGFSMTCSGDVADVTFEGNRISLSYPTRVIDGVPTQVTAHLTRQSSRIRRIDSAAESVLVSSYETNAQTFPFHALPAEIEQYEARLALVREPAATPFDAGSLAGEYLLPTSGLSADLSANRVILNADGTGTDLDAATPLTWSVNAGGELSIAFANRDARLIPLRDESPFTRDVLALIAFDNGTRAVSHRFALRKDDASTWTDASALVGSWTQVAGRQGGASTFHYQFDASRSAPSFNTYVEGEFEGQQFPGMVMHWSFEAPGTIVLRRCESLVDDVLQAIAVVDREPDAGECTSYHRRREWTLYSVDGANAYVHEVNEDWWNDPTANAPQYRFSRPQLYGFEAAEVRAKASGDAPADGVGARSDGFRDIESANTAR